MLTTRDITDLISAPASGMQNGRLMAIAQRERRANLNPATPNQRQLLEDLRGVPVRPAARVAYNHPAAPPLPRRTDGEPLAASELAWLQRLPNDPTQISHNDASTLAAMAASLSPQTNTADRRLVDAIWLPVRDVHDRNAAQIDVTAAAAGAPATIPSSALNALGDAVAAEHPDLQPHEALARASDILATAATRRTAAHQQRLTAAQARVDQLNQSIADRNAVTR